MTRSKENSDCNSEEKPIKGTHAWDFHSLFLNFFLHLSVTNIYKTQYSQHFRKYSWNSPRYSKFLISRHFRRKREAWLSVVAENAELNLALSSQLCVFGSFWAFSAKKRSHTSRFWRMHGVKLIVVGENAESNCALSAVYSVFKEETKLCVFGEYVEWNVAFSLKTRSETVRFRR